MIRIFHWWPGREFKGSCPIPSFVVNRARELGSRYLTVAMTTVDDKEIAGWAYCCPKDVPSREMGRQIAIGRLRSMLEELGIDNGLL